MIILGLVLLVLALIFGLPILLWIGIALMVVGAILLVAGPVGPTGTRRRYY